jgi:hypothetical protein
MVTKILNEVKEKAIGKKAPLTKEELIEIAKKFIS